MKAVKIAKPVLPMDVITIKNDKNEMTDLITAYAKASNGKYNLAQFKGQKVLLVQHRAVCQQVLQFQTDHPEMPLYAILAAGISQGACRESEFRKGYKSFNRDRATFVCEMTNKFNEIVGIKGKPSDVTYRLVMKYYNDKSQSREQFVADVTASKDKLDGKRGHFPELCKALGIEK